MNDPWSNPSWWMMVTVSTSALSAVVMFVVTQVLTYLWQWWLSRLPHKANARRAGQIEAALVLPALNDIAPAAEAGREENCCAVPVFQVHQQHGPATTTAGGPL